MDSTLQRYLNDIGRTALLTHEEEIKYGKQVQRMISLQAAQEPLAHEPSEISEVVLQKIINTGQRAKQKMVEANLRLVIAIALAVSASRSRSVRSNSRGQYRLV